MAVVGFVTPTASGGFQGQFRGVEVLADISIRARPGQAERAARPSLAARVAALVTRPWPPPAPGRWRGLVELTLAHFEL